MPVQKGKSILRVALDEALIMELKLAALKTKVSPRDIVAAALRSHLFNLNNRQNE